MRLHKRKQLFGLQYTPFKLSDLAAHLLQNQVAPRQRAQNLVLIKSDRFLRLIAKALKILAPRHMLYVFSGHNRSRFPAKILKAHPDRMRDAVFHTFFRKTVDRSKIIASRLGRAAADQFFAFIARHTGQCRTVVGFHPDDLSGHFLHIPAPRGRIFQAHALVAELLADLRHTGRKTRLLHRISIDHNIRKMLSDFFDPTPQMANIAFSVDRPAKRLSIRSADKFDPACRFFIFNKGFQTPVAGRVFAL